MRSRCKVCTHPKGRRVQQVVKTAGPNGLEVGKTFKKSCDCSCHKVKI